MAAMEALDRGREAFRCRAWGAAYAGLFAADREGPLEIADLERLAVAAQLIGRDDESADAWARAHQACLSQNDVARAARCAFWLGLSLLLKGEMARGGGWLARARRLLDDGQRDCVERGYLLVPVALQCIDEGDAATAYTTFDEAARIGARFGETDLITFGNLGRGQSLIHLGEVARGMALLDEVMVAVTAGETSPIATGILYCAVIEACHETFNLRRAQEWTAALSHWCESQPDLVLYRGQCLVHRSEIMQLRGAWPDAMEQARQACEWLSQPTEQPAIGAAFYQQAELHRLRGELEQAEAAYRQASHWGRATEPGLALLRLTQGQIAAASAAMRRAIGEAQGRVTRIGRPLPADVHALGDVGEAQDWVTRSRLLSAHVEIMLVLGDVQAARYAADELTSIAADLDATYLHAVSAYAGGAVLLAEGDARAALGVLRRSWTCWQQLDVPYEAARARVLIGLACRAHGDEETAGLELDAARRVFQRLGAAPDLDRVDLLLQKTPIRAVGGLTARELQVLREVADGKTNRAIASALVISEKTVARHLSNIFAKLDLSSRAAATAYAYQHDLL